MNRLANVLVASNDSRRSSRLMGALTSSRCEAVLCTDAAAFLAHARADQPDLAILDGVSLGDGGLQAAATLRGDCATAHVPLVLFVDAHPTSIHSRALEIGADDVIVEPVPDEEFIHRIRPLFRLSTMRAEMNRRITLAREFGLDVVLPPGSGSTVPCRILIAGQGSFAAKDAEAAFGARPCTITTCEDTAEAEVLLASRTFDICLLRVPSGVAQAPFGHLTFCNQARDNPRLFNLPIVVVAPAAVFEQMDAQFLRHGATRVLPEGFDPATLRYVLLSLVDRQRTRWSLRAALEATRKGVTQDQQVGTYTFDFLEAHVARLIESARTWRKHLSIVFLNFPNLSKLRKEIGPKSADQLFLQLAQWTGSLIRAEDMVARHGTQGFCVALPDTPLREAEAVMHRVAGVLSYTDFAIPDVYHPVSVWVELGLADLQPDDTVEDLFARARHYMDYTRAAPT